MNISNKNLYNKPVRLVTDVYEWGIDWDFVFSEFDLTDDNQAIRTLPVEERKRVIKTWLLNALVPYFMSGRSERIKLTKEQKRQAKSNNHLASLMPTPIWKGLSEREFCAAHLICYVEHFGLKVQKTTTSRGALIKGQAVLKHLIDTTVPKPSETVGAFRSMLWRAREAEIASPIASYT